jgi:hypothetical protein
VHYPPALPAKPYENVINFVVDVFSRPDKNGASFFSPPVSPNPKAPKKPQQEYGYFPREIGRAEDTVKPFGPE